MVERTNWRHASDAPDRAEAVTHVAGMLNGLIAQARTTGLRLAPFVGIACPGQIREDGSIAHGAQNLPGDWEANGFNLPRELRQRLDPIEGTTAGIAMHNDAVVQGLSEYPRMRKAKRWAVLTIGTGLGTPHTKWVARRGASDAPCCGMKYTAADAQPAQVVRFTALQVVHRERHEASA